MFPVKDKVVQDKALSDARASKPWIIYAALSRDNGTWDDASGKL